MLHTTPIRCVMLTPLTERGKCLVLKTPLRLCCCFLISLPSILLMFTAGLDTLGSWNKNNRRYPKHCCSKSHDARLYQGQIKGTPLVVWWSMNMGHHTVEGSAVSEAILVEVFRGTGTACGASVASSVRAALKLCSPPFRHVSLSVLYLTNPFTVD